MAVIYRNLLILRSRPPASSVIGLTPLARRLAVIAASAALLAFRRRRSLVTTLAVGIAAVLLERAIAGRDDLGTIGAWLAEHRGNDPVDSAIEASFPASDAPAWSGSSAVTAP